jgi:hypothetical protein
MKVKLFFRWSERESEFVALPNQQPHKPKYLVSARLK